jgi:C4-dicarboxylate-specific signal transduction histidine kinase
MWKQLIVPTLVVSVLWLIMSNLTTYFIYWLDESYQQALTKNLTAMRAAGVVREDVWKLMSYADSAGLRRIMPEMTGNVEKSLRELRSLATTPEQKPLVERLESQWQSFAARIMRAGDGPANVSDRFSRMRDLRGNVEAISATANEIRQFNQELSNQGELRREHWKGIILTLRFVLIVVGPLIGIALGWWMSQRLNRSISQINIILKDATVEWEQSLATLRLSDREDLGGIRDRVERVVERMRSVNAELVASRSETLRSERLAAVGELAAGVAHELRNPLTSVKLLLQNAAQLSGGARLQSDESRLVLDEISRMERTIQGLLDFSRPPSAQRRRHDLRDTLNRAYTLVQGRSKQQQVCIESEMPSQEVWVDGDPEQLHQVCVNLLINGIESMTLGGQLRVRVSSNRQGSCVRVDFHDSGPGIPDELLAHMFDPFVSTKVHGTGLGLAISRRIITQHGGKLTAENHPDGGAVLSLELPVPGPESQREPAARCDDTIASAL